MRHLALTAAAAIVGSLTGLIAAWEGQIAFFFPAIALAGGAGAFSTRRWEAPSGITIAVMLAASAAWLGVNVSRADVYAWPVGFETWYTGSGYCGDFSCFEQIGVTLPFLVCLAYLMGSLVAAGPQAARQSWVGPGAVAYLAAFTATWFGLSWSTQGSQFERHVYPYSRSGWPAASATPDLWPFVAAGDEFVSQPPRVQHARAAEFYDSVMRELAHDNYFDPDPYRDTFIRGSLEAGLRPYTGTLGQHNQYRDIFGYSIAARSLPRREIPRLTRDAALLAVVPASLLLAGWWLASRKRPEEETV
jgi:hypothetical protein